MDLADLYYFKEICETGSFSTAADNCSISQSSISKRIKALETELGTDLFTREHRSFTITEAGRIVLEHTLKILDIKKTMDSDLERLKSANDNSINLSLLGYSTHYGLWPLIMNFFYRNADVQNQVKIMPPAEMRSRLQRHERILCISYDYGWDDTDVCKVPLTSDYYSVMIPAGNPLFDQEEISFLDLDGREVCMQDRSSIIRIIMDEALRDQGIHPQIRFEDFYPDSVFRAALLSKRLYPSLRNACSVYIPQDIRVAVFREKLTAELVLVYERGRRLSTAETDFIRFLTDNKGLLLQKEEDGREALSSTEEKLMFGNIQKWD